MADLNRNYALVLKQEKELVFDHFNYDDAWNLGSLMAQKARDEKLPLAMKIVLNGYTVFQYACEGSNISNDRWMQRKINTVNMMQVSSLHVSYMSLMGEDDICKDWFFSPEIYAVCGGGFPIRIRETGMIGVVTVSGLPDWQDHNFIVECLNSFLGKKVELVE